MMTATYNIQAETLKDMMATVLEIQDIVGMEPIRIGVFDNTDVAFDSSDAKKLIDGKMSTIEYINRHVLSKKDDDT